MDTVLWICRIICWMVAVFLFQLAIRRPKYRVGKFVAGMVLAFATNLWPWTSILFTIVIVVAIGTYRPSRRRRRATG